LRGGFEVASPKSSSTTSEATVTLAGATLQVDAAKLGDEGAGQRLRRARPPEATRQREGSPLSSSPLSPPLAGAASAAAASAIAGLRSTTGAAAPLCAPAVVTGAFSIERRGRERKRRAGGGEGDEASELLLGAFSTEKTVAPLGAAAPGTLQAETTESEVIQKKKEGEGKEA